MELIILQGVGYAASLMITLSMMVNSIIKFRWINLAGALTFSVYGFLISATPVGVLNGIIVVVDIYYLVMIYTKKEQFEILAIRPDNLYLIRFLAYHNNDIQKFFPGFAYNPDMNTVSFFILRNMSVAGLFLAHREDGNVLKVGLDYVIPDYRDFKNGKYVYLRIRDNFLKDGFTRVTAEGNNMKYVSYLKGLGFRKDETGLYARNL